MPGEVPGGPKAEVTGLIYRAQFSMGPKPEAPEINIWLAEEIEWYKGEDLDWDGSYIGHLDDAFKIVRRDNRRVDEEMSGGHLCVIQMAQGPMLASYENPKNEMPYYMEKLCRKVLGYNYGIYFMHYKGRLMMLYPARKRSLEVPLRIHKSRPREEWPDQANENIASVFYLHNPHSSNVVLLTRPDGSWLPALRPHHQGVRGSALCGSSQGWFTEDRKEDILSRIILKLGVDILAEPNEVLYQLRQAFNELFAEYQSQLKAMNMCSLMFPLRKVFLQKGTGRKLEEEY